MDLLFTKRGKENTSNFYYHYYYYYHYHWKVYSFLKHVLSAIWLVGDNFSHCLPLRSHCGFTYRCQSFYPNCIKLILFVTGFSSL